jgi:3-dehydroquinate synthase
MPKIDIQLPAAALPDYSVHVDSGLLGRLGKMVHQIAPAPGCALITDSVVAQLYGKQARDSLEQVGFKVTLFVFPAGESSKTTRVVEAAYDVLLTDRLERRSPVVALGGGVVGDLAGFVAATLLRGVPFVQVPTTLLAAVDASVGGKVGVDHAHGKNMVGAFHHPCAVLMDVQTLRTLPKIELQCGLAECVKHAIIRDARLFDFIGANLPAIFARNSDVLVELVAWNVRIKSAIVMADPYEQGVRAVLNLGHTFGHALETLAGYKGLKHGQAVGLGTLAASTMARKRGILDETSHTKIETLLRRIGLLETPPAVDITAVMELMRGDKKVRDGQLRLILPTAIGSAEIISDARPDEIAAALEAIASPLNGGVRR